MPPSPMKPIRIVGSPIDTACQQGTFNFGLDQVKFPVASFAHASHSLPSLAEGGRPQAFVARISPETMIKAPRKLVQLGISLRNSAARLEAIIGCP